MTATRRLPLPTRQWFFDAHCCCADQDLHICTDNAGPARITESGPYANRMETRAAPCCLVRRVERGYGRHLNREGGMGGEADVMSE